MKSAALVLLALASAPALAQKPASGGEAPEPKGAGTFRWLADDGRLRMAVPITWRPAAAARMSGEVWSMVEQGENPGADGSIDRVIIRSRPFAESLAEELVRQTALGLAFAHGQAAAESVKLFTRSPGPAINFSFDLRSAGGEAVEYDAWMVHDREGGRLYSILFTCAQGTLAARKSDFRRIVNSITYR